MTAISPRHGVATRSRLFHWFIWASLALLSISVLGATENAAMSMAGRWLFYAVALAFVPVLAYLAATSLAIPKISVSVVAMLTVLLFIHTMYSVIGFSLAAVTFFVQYMVVFSSFMIFMQAGMSGANAGFRLVAFLSVSILAIYAGLLLLDPSKASGEGWGGGLSNQNVFGMFVFMLLCVAGVMLSLGGRPPLLLIIALMFTSVLLIYASKSRSCLLALGLFYCTYFAWPFICRSRRLGAIYFGTALIVIWYMTYSGANRIALADSLEQVLKAISHSYGKNVDSGRPALWNLALDHIAERPIFGWGIRDNATSALNIHLSFHNWYLTIAYYFGLFGLSAYILLLYLVWITLCGSGDRPYSKIAGAALMGMMMTQIFEVSLTLNHLNIGIVYWALFGLVIGRLARDRAFARQIPRPTAAQSVRRAA